MILQRIAWPDRIEDRELFYRSEGSVELEPKSAAFHLSGHSIRFDTYFNVFSLCKWKKHTRLEGVSLSLELKGEAEISLLRHDLEGELIALPAISEQPEFEAITTAVRTERFHFDEYTAVALDYPDCEGAVGLSFLVRPLSGGASLRNAAYCTPSGGAKPETVNLALAICTYNREKYVAANMDMLKRNIFDVPSSPLNGHVRVYIADNGQTLDIHRFEGMPVTIYPNKNSGGSGGFSRAAIEAIHDDNYQATHVILMDDDISFNAWALERHHAFLSLIKPEYAINLLGGAMLNADHRHLLYAAGELFSLKCIENDREDWNLLDLKYILLGETDIPVDYYGWWYCCIPVPLLKQKQFSMPFFVQYDDIEFSLRCGDVPKICLNGVCCWHDPLKHKETDARYYYNYRNSTIMELLYYPKEFNAKRLKFTLFRDCAHMVFTFTYGRAHMTLRGIEDFLKGVDWLTSQDPAALNKELLAALEPAIPADQVPVPFDPQDIIMNKILHKNPIESFLRLITVNGWVFPAKRKVVVVEKFWPHMQYFYRAGTVVKYDVDTHMALVARRSYREAFRVARHLFKTLRAIDKGFDRVADEWRDRHDEITSEAFWRQFLGF